ncbi:MULTISPECIES: methionine ABC transporter ATP-binding protein [Aeromicrobium]|uniref:methionine ABC transporter ATP-binding protein n=1 Tax=Aeromicrobium TaxID=2040 RepID=UPI0006FE8A92|nr:MULTISPECIES: ATP-binding cassette domain-containing protein [Aeromicrobium]KQX71774.1 methionine ABC transporter ATP-binding protein [Aeromicrobium sp. Root472D3]MCL8251839.1 ATP-binding cassette domain-containing protein [Aeromicrobium fastidiosum]
MTLIELQGVSKTFPPTRKGGDPVHAVRDVDLSVEAGEIVGIVGYSGAGKSTLVRLVNALEPTTSGRLLVDGTDLTTLRERQLQKVRLGIGMIFQQFNLLQSRTVWGNVAYPLEVAKVPKAEHQRRISDLLTFVGLADKAHAWPEELSGGQKQRVGIARALATSPKILLADEATSALDPETTVEVLRLLKKVNTELGITIVVITHEMDVVKTIADRVVVMEQGRIVEQGPVFDIFSAPQEQATRRFVSTLVDAVPDAVALEGLRRTHSGRLLTLSFRDESVSQSAVFAEIIGRGVEFELVFGGIEDVRGRSFGHLTLELRGDPAAVDEAVAAVTALVETTEVA